MCLQTVKNKKTQHCLVFPLIFVMYHLLVSNVSQRRLEDAAKKAIGKLQLRTIKKGDKVDGILCTHENQAMFLLH